MNGLRPWQQEAVACAGLRGQGFLADPRTGKTRAAVAALAAVRDHRSRVVITAPLIVVADWQRELALHGIDAVSLVGVPAKKRADAIKGAGVVLLNHDLLSHSYGILAKWGVTHLIGDEAHWFSAAGSKRGKAFRRIASSAEWIRTLTGTPAPNNLGGLWGHMSAVAPEKWGTSYTKFAKKYLLMNPIFPSKVDGYRDEDGSTIMALLHEDALVVPREDVFGPEEWQNVVREIELPKPVKTLYRKLAKEWLAEPTEGAFVEGSHAFKRAIRFSQITAGYVPDETGTVHELHRGKVDAVLADLDEIIATGEQAVVFYRFRWEGETYRREIASRFKCPVYRIDGDTTAAERDDAVRAFERGGAAVMVVQTRAGGIGISLATATHALFPTCDYSYVAHKQARDRIFCPGKSRCVTTYVVPGTVDITVQDALNKKISLGAAITRSARMAVVGSLGAD